MTKNIIVVIIIKIMKFVNRKDELQFLESCYLNSSAQLIVIYGRRRIGKTELLLQFSKNKPHIYFLASETTESDNLDSLFKRISDFYKDEILTYEKDWENLFRYLARKKERMILIIDEFPYLISQNKAIPSIFQKGWDLYLKDSKIFLILAGSSVGMMETHILGYNSPLYGRRTGQWKLLPLEFRDLNKFFPRYTLEELIGAYGILDAIPSYLIKFRPELSLRENLEEHLLSKGAFLYEEVDFLLRQELREPKLYKAILKAMASGYTKFGEIMSLTGIDKSKLFVYLDTLESLELIEKRVPILKKGRSRKSRYYIRDNFFNFYFRYLLPNKSLLEEGQRKFVLKKVQADFQNYIGRFVWEKVCQEFLWKNLELLPFFPERIGKHWGTYREKGETRSYEFDLLAVNFMEKKVMFIECKWKDGIEAGKVISELKRKSAHLQWRKKERKEYYCIMAKSFKDKPRPSDNVLFIDLRKIGNELISKGQRAN